MGFRTLERTIGRAVDPVRFTFAYPRDCEDARLHIVVVGYLLRRVCGVDADPDYDCAADKFSVQIGTDEDHGRARIVVDLEGAFSPTHAPKTDTYLFRLGHVAEMPDDVTAKKQAVIRHEIVDDGVLEIEFPRWIYEPRFEPDAEMLEIAHEPLKALPAPGRHHQAQLKRVK